MRRWIPVLFMLIAMILPVACGSGSSSVATEEIPPPPMESPEEPQPTPEPPPPPPIVVVRNATVKSVYAMLSQDLPLGGVEYALYDADGERYQATSGDDGVAVFPELLPGFYRLVVDYVYPGFADIDEEIEIRLFEKNFEFVVEAGEANDVLAGDSNSDTGSEGGGIDSQIERLLEADDEYADVVNRTNPNVRNIARGNTPLLDLGGNFGAQIIRDELDRYSCDGEHPRFFFVRNGLNDINQYLRIDPPNRIPQFEALLEEVVDDILDRCIMPVLFLCLAARRG